MSEFRKDPIQGRWILIDENFPLDEKKIHRVEGVSDLAEHDADCPFCPGRENITGAELLRYNFITKEKADWDIRVIPNRIPALRVETEMAKEADGLYDWMSGTGADEIVIESPFHNDLAHHIPLNRVEQVFWAFHDRILDLRKDERLKYLLFMKNFGRQSGDSLIHPHSRMIGLPFIPSTLEEELVGGEEYFELKERCVYCDIVKQEMKSGVRVVAVNDYFVSFCPYASRYPFEMWIFPIHHASHFESSSKNHLYYLAEIYGESFKRLHQTLGDVPYTAILHNGPLQEGDLSYFHWHIEICPILICQPGQTMGAQFYINPVPPEDAAQSLREGRE